MTKTAIPRLLAISDRAQVEPTDWFDQIRATVERQGGDSGLAVLLREKDLDDRALWELAKKARHHLPSSVPLLIHGRADVAIAADAQGVHLASPHPVHGDPPLAQLRRCFGHKLLFGISTHHELELEQARRHGADYVTFSPIFATPGKGEPVGLEALASAAEVTELPVLALGGVDASRLQDIATHGAYGAAGIRCFQAPHLAPMLNTARRIWGAQTKS